MTARRWRGVLIVALVLFLAGSVWSIRELGVVWSDLDWTAGALALLLVAPSIWFNALELQLCARAAGNSMPLAQALCYSNVATLSNLLPVPASAIVRGGALVKNGASLAASGQIVLAAGLIWLAMAAGISAAAIIPGSGGLMAGAAAAGVAAGIAAWIARRSGIGVASGFVAVRVALLGLAVVRLHFCFAAIGVMLPPEDVAVYTVASILGSAAGIVPAGLGVSEGIAAALAVLAYASPAAAFLSIGLNRLLGLIGSAVVVLGFAWTAPTGAGGRV